MKLMKVLLLSILLMTSSALLVQDRLPEGRTSEVVFTTKCFVSPSAQLLQVITSPKTGEEYVLVIFDPEKRSALINERKRGVLKEEIVIPHSGPYCVVISSKNPVTAAIKVNMRYTSGKVLNIEYGMGGVSALLLAFLMLWEGRKNDKS